MSSRAATGALVGIVLFLARLAAFWLRPSALETIPAESDPSTSLQTVSTNDGPSRQKRSLDTEATIEVAADHFLKGPAERSVSNEQASPARRRAGADQSDAELSRELQAYDALGTERRFLTKAGTLDAGEFRDLLGGESFLAEIESLREESFGLAEAQELTLLYADFLNEMFDSHGGYFVLDDLSCGVRLCLGQASAISEEASWSRNGLNRRGQNGPPMHATISDRVGLPGQDPHVFQFVFSTDPDNRAIAIPAPSP